METPCALAEVNVRCASSKMLFCHIKTVPEAHRDCLPPSTINFAEA
jgi:hypothetical protein